MRRTDRNLWKKLALCAVVFSLAMPAAGKECRAYDDSVEAAYLEEEQEPGYWTVHVDKGYLALRTGKAYDSRNEIAELYTGDRVEVLDNTDSGYWYVYVPKLDANGYVNKDYLLAPVSRASAFYWSVHVDKGYLALRSAKAYDDRNEIGELYTGDAVELLDTSDSTYWKVYSLKHDKTGYVNKDYLEYIYSGNSRWSVSVDKGYLALRTARAYDERNEIGELYTGDVVEISDTSDSTYWYVYAPKLQKFGYVNKDYLIYTPGKTRSTYKTVRVDKGYLALRYARAYDECNEIGELYTGDKVEVRDSSDSGYWYVYAPKLEKFGYVNKDYLY